MMFYSVDAAYLQAQILKCVPVAELNELQNFNSNSLLIKTLPNYFNSNTDKAISENKRIFSINSK